MNTPAPMLRKRILPAVAATAAIALLAGGAWYGYETIASQSIQRVVFAGDLQRIARSDLEAFAQGVRGNPSSGASLLAIREAARRIPWVRDASVRRRFPDAVEVTFEAHEPLARWGEGALLSARGDVFTATHEGFLPRFKGPDAAAALMIREYRAISKTLAPLAIAITDLRLSPRGAWQVVLDSGLTLEIGRGDLEARLARFVEAWPQLVAEGVDTKHIDLRYPNGFAVAKNDKVTKR